MPGIQLTSRLRAALAVVAGLLCVAVTTAGAVGPALLDRLGSARADAVVGRGDQPRTSVVDHDAAGPSREQAATRVTAPVRRPLGADAGSPLCMLVLVMIAGAGVVFLRPPRHD